ncbi:SDR family oxidoreductase [Mucilaginibacter agri]|uniref:SDR family NAD(P)-dependent oxidoreductase n=1 Tax=Mucilaginibacter agri TaxID=2695265 RepID=A0A965ZIK7_9SPHI|nr:SDR family oxidoreductase [Mucilaginibacter agri]NCD71345.1 SDR family NAD(P)-dependent oxidoreductase [Mucilaginibacter agri]
MTKTIFITGTSAGIGKATAKLFAAKGWKVIATMRRPENDTELARLNNVTVLPLDVTDLDQIKDATQKALSLGNIDVVFNNAGYALLGPLEATTDEQIVKQMETNFLGTVRVVQAFIPNFKAKKSGLFINMTSSAGIMAFPFSSMYDASKWALEGWSESLSFELEQFNIGIKNIEPGLVATDMSERTILPSHTDYDDLLAKFLAIVNNPQSISTPEQIAEIVYEAATDGKDILRYVCGEDAKAMYAQRLEVGDEAFRKGLKQLIFGE